MHTSSPLAVLLLAVGLAFGPAPALAQLVRQPNTTLNLPEQLSGGAFGSLTFAFPVAVRTPAGVTDRTFVVERNTGIQLVDLLSNQKVTFMPLAQWVNDVDEGGEDRSLDTGGESGILSMAFHPDYNDNGYFYVFYSVFIDSVRYQRVARFQATGTPGNYNQAVSADPETHLPLITQLDERNNHNGGDLAFGPEDGYLYISVGDEGASNDSLNNARFIDKDFFGAILRIDVDRLEDNLEPNTHPAVNINPGTGQANYKVPADNPFIGATEWHGLAITPASVRTEIFATGLRNPWRMSFDPVTGRLFTGDVGQGAYEEVDIIVAGGDYGWSWREGMHEFNSHPAPDEPTDPADFTPIDPINEYGRSLGYSITGGYVYRGTRIADLTGDYVFGDYGSGRVWALREGVGGAWTRRELVDLSNNQLVAFGVDPRNGDILLCMAGGQILRLLDDAPGVNPPALLSQTGAFTSLATLTPAAGIVAYEPNVSFWSDGAVKQRWFSIPDTADRMGFSRDGNWQFPAGQVWIKHFEIQTNDNPVTVRRLETRFLVKTENSAYGITYKWRANNSNADLVATAGENETLAITLAGVTANQVWRYPSRGECMSCHTAAAGFGLGFTSRQMTRDRVYGAETRNQIEALRDAGYFTNEPPVEHIHTIPALAPADDEGASREWRVRSYLAANCAHCHLPGGLAQGTWDARDHISTAATGMINGPVVNTAGNPAFRNIVPGDPALSMIVHRIQSLNPSTGVQHMPPLATNKVDAAAVALLTDWITIDLPERQTFAEWQVENFGSSADPDAAPGEDPDGDGQDNMQEFLARTNPESPGVSPVRPELALDLAEGVLEVSFQELANRALILEASTDLVTWEDWDVPGNAPEYSAEGGLKTLSVPLDETELFLRPRLEEL